jgi:hypothetical protein
MAGSPVSAGDGESNVIDGHPLSPAVIGLLEDVLVHSQSRFLRGVPSQFTEADLP